MQGQGFVMNMNWFMAFYIIWYTTVTCGTTNIVVTFCNETAEQLLLKCLLWRRGPGLPPLAVSCRLQSNFDRFSPSLLPFHHHLHIPVCDWRGPSWQFHATCDDTAINCDKSATGWQVEYKMTRVLGILAFIWEYNQSTIWWQPAEWSPLLQRCITEKLCFYGADWLRFTAVCWQ